VGGIESPDRVEGAGLEFHLRARAEFLALAARDAGHYLVLPARTDREEIAAAVRERVAPLLSEAPGTLTP
jgi:dTMP kinase